MIATTYDRVEQHTAPAAKDRIRAHTFAHVRYYREHPEEIPARLAALKREWDIERALETGSATLTLTGLVLGATVDRRWYLLSAAVQGFFLQHALQGWCPPLPVMRRLGIRTLREIEEERRALEALQSQVAVIVGLA